MGAHPFFEIDDAIAAAHEEENPLHTKHRARHDHQPPTTNHNKLYDATPKLAALHNPYLQACDESAVKHGSSQRIPVCSRTSQVAGCRTIHHACMVYSGNQLLLRAGAERSHAGSLAVPWSPATGTDILTGKPVGLSLPRFCGIGNVGGPSSIIISIPQASNCNHSISCQSISQLRHAIIAPTTDSDEQTATAKLHQTCASTARTVAGALACFASALKT